MLILRCSDIYFNIIHSDADAPGGTPVMQQSMKVWLISRMRLSWLRRTLTWLFLHTNYQLIISLRKFIFPPQEVIRYFIKKVGVWP